MNYSRPDNLPRILVLGDAIAPTGFSRVIYKIFEPLHHSFEIHQLGVNYQGNEHSWPWKIYPALEADSPFGFSKLPQLLDEINPLLIFMLSDDVVLAGWMKLVSKWKGRNRTRVLIYCPVDTNPLKYPVVTDLLGGDRLFTYTEFGRQCFVECLSKQAGSARLAIERMPHGVDSSVFYPLENDITYHLSPEGRLKSKRRLVGENNAQLDDTFIVLNANRNQERKRMDVTIRGFARFAAGKPDNVMLYLHCGVKDLGWDIIELAGQEEMLDRLIVSTIEGVKPAFPDAELNAVYNACETGINTSSAEGWGLVNFEHATTGAAQLIPGHTGCRELWEGHASMLRPSTSITHTEDLKEHYIISPVTVADSLERLYQDKDYYYAMCIAAYKNATRPDYKWENISQRWHEIFQEELARLLGVEIHASEKDTEIHSEL